jgi:hypothetical protein
MKKLLFIAYLMTTTLMSFSQETQKVDKDKYFVAFSVGPSFPTGVFAATNLDTEPEAGFAKTGFNINLHLGYQIVENFGIASSLSYSNYKLDETSIKKYLVDGGSNNTSMNADHWQDISFVVGPMGTIKISDKLFADVKGMVGITNANMPVFRFNLAGSSSTLITPEKWSYAFAYQIGTDLRYNFGKNICFFTNLDYVHTKPFWKFDVVSNGTTESFRVEQNMGAIDLNVGLGVTF